MLAGIEVEVASAEGVEGFVGAAFDDVSAFDHQDLVSPADGREAVRDHEGGAALHEEAESLLDHGFGFGVEGRCRFVKDEDARVGEDGAGDAQGWRWPA